MFLRLLAAGREVHTVVSWPRRALEARRTVEIGDVQPIERDSFVVADRDNRTGRMDAAAGCEFVDDRIRLRE